MGGNTFSHDAFKKARAQHTQDGASATARGEETVCRTGKLDPLVDPAEYGVIRPSRIRLKERPDGSFVVEVGTSVPTEYRVDTTGSMGDNVDRALAALPQLCDLVAEMLPGRDPFYCASIFGDLMDRQGRGFPLCRGQFECEAGKMVNQLTLMHPERDGCGNGGEDPHYGFFASAYLTNSYFRRIGLKSYDFTISDEPVHEGLSDRQLVRIFGDEVFEKVRANGHELDRHHLPDNRELVQYLLTQAHAFGLLVEGRRSSLRAGWEDMFGKEHVIMLPRIELVPHVMATIIGLTEGAIDLQSAVDFLTGREIGKGEAHQVVDAVAHIPLGAQQTLPNFARMPKKGDVFATKTDLWPVDVSDSAPKADEGGEPSGGWL